MNLHPTKQCKRGHDMTGDNLYVRANGVRYCRACQYELDWRAPAPRATQAQGAIMVKRIGKTHCKRGHDMTDAVPNRDGSRRCKTCKRMARANASEEQRAAIAKKRKEYNERNYAGVKSFSAPVILGSRPSNATIAEAQRRASAPHRDLAGMFLGDPPVGFSMLDRRGAL